MSSRLTHNVIFAGCFDFSDWWGQGSFWVLRPSIRCHGKSKVLPWRGRCLKILKQFQSILSTMRIVVPATEKLRLICEGIRQNFLSVILTKDYYLSPSGHSSFEHCLFHHPCKLAKEATSPWCVWEKRFIIRLGQRSESYLASGYDVSFCYTSPAWHFDSHKLSWIKWLAIIKNLKTLPNQAIEIDIVETVLRRCKEWMHTCVQCTHVYSDSCCWSTCMAQCH